MPLIDSKKPRLPKATPLPSPEKGPEPPLPSPKRKKEPNWPLLYVVMAIFVFALGLLVIALMNYWIEGVFTI